MSFARSLRQVVSKTAERGPQLWMHKRFPDLFGLLIGAAKRIVERPPEPSVATEKPQLDADVVLREVQDRSSIPDKMAR